jgi:hypothetical protein
MTERGEGRNGMPSQHRMTNCTARSQGRDGHA